MATNNRVFVHLINDEKFINPFKKRATDIVDKHVFVVFGPKPPYKFLESDSNIIHSSEWSEFRAKNEKQVERVYIHLMTYQKIKWMSEFPDVPLYWLFYGNDLYELLHAFKGFNLYAPEDRPSGLMTQVSGATFSKRLKRWFQLWMYQKSYGPFVKSRVNYFCFWNPGDYELLVEHYHSQAKMLRFQYGAFNPSDIDLVKQKRLEKGDNSTTLKVILNHSGSSSGNHHHLIEKLASLWSNESQVELTVPLSYGNPDHIKSVRALGTKVLPNIFKPLDQYMSRDEYFQLLSDQDIAIMGHRRQEAGNTLFILLMSGAKVFMHPNSVLLTFLKQEGYHFYTWNDIGGDHWMDPLTDVEKEVNFKLADQQFSEQRILENYHRILD